MNSKIAIEEYKKIARALKNVSGFCFQSQILKKEMDEQQKATKQGDPTPRTYHNITTPLSDMTAHIDSIFEKQIGRLIVSEAGSEVWSTKKKLTKNKGKKREKK